MVQPIMACLMSEQLSEYSPAPVADDDREEINYLFTKKNVSNFIY